MFLVTLLSEAGVVIVSVTILNKVSIVDLTLSHLALPVCPVLVTAARVSGAEIAFCTILAVSYTHLTLPTNREV